MSLTLRPSLRPYPEISLPELLAGSAHRFPGKIAAIHGSRTATFEELNTRCAGIALGLAELDLQPGQRVALMGQNSIDYIAAFFGILKAGGIVVPFSPAYTAREIASQLGNCEPSAAIIDTDLMESFMAAGGNLISKEKRICTWSSPASGALSLTDFDISPALPVKLQPVAPDDLAVIAYSSGTTGVPKGVMLTHRNLATNLIQFQHQDPVPITDADTFLNHLPFFHIYGMNVLMAEAIALGATQVIMSRFDLEELVDLIARHRATLLFTVAPVLLSLVHLPQLADRAFSSLRYVNTGAAPLPPEVAREFRSSRATALRKPLRPSTRIFTRLPSSNRSGLLWPTPRSRCWICKIHKKF